MVAIITSNLAKAEIQGVNQYYWIPDHVRDGEHKGVVMKRIVLACIVMLLSVACSKAPVTTEAVGKTFSAEQPVNVVATIGMIADVAKVIGGDFVKVTGLMGPGVDPHLYKASEGDIQRLSQADLILYNGLNLEGKMADILVKMARGRMTVAVTEDVNESVLRSPEEFEGHYDPHLWFDVTLWQNIATKIGATFAEFDPAHADTYLANAKAYVQTLAELDQWTKTNIAKIPAGQRVLVTAHDAFGYFGRAYGIEVIGLQGVSTVSEFGLADVGRVVDMLVERKIPAVFVESSIPKRSIEAVIAGAKARGHDVVVGGELFSDAMGHAGTKAGTYIGMVESNVNTIVNALTHSMASAE